MYRKIILSTIAILTLLYGCVPAQFEVGVEPTATPTEAAPEIEPTTMPEIIEATAEPTDSPVEFGEVSGSVCFPSEFIPAMTIYFRDTSDGMLYALSNGENASSYTSELPLGNYIAFGYPDNVDFGGMYSAAVPCGLNVDCLDHTPLPFDVLAGQTTTGIDICDWYAEPNQVPQNPNAAFQVNPSLAGLVYQDLNAGGIW
jgi:hypothetical protein